VKTNLTEIQALTLNFVENVNRKNLNILEEAYGIDRFMKAGKTIDQISKLINQPKGWVRVRKLLLEMPPVIQQDAAAGFITQLQINDLAQLHSEDDQIATVLAIKEARARGERRLPPIKKKKQDPTKLKRRNYEEIFDMNDHIIEQFKESNILTRGLAWANGEISDLDLYRDIIEYAKSRNIKYSPPLEVQSYLRQSSANEVSKD
jgi:hypothetical protein